MNKWHKFGIAAGITGSAAFITYLINRVIFSTSVSLKLHRLMTDRYTTGDLVIYHIV